MKKGIAVLLLFALLWCTIVPSALPAQASGVTADEAPEVEVDLSPEPAEDDTVEVDDLFLMDEALGLDIAGASDAIQAEAEPNAAEDASISEEALSFDMAEDALPNASDDDLRSGFYYYRIEDGNCIITDVEEEPVLNEDGDVVDWDKLQYVNVAIPASIDGCPVTRIDNGVFCDAKNLKAVTFPDCLKEIGWDAFAGCESLGSAKLPAGLALLECGAFSECVSLKAINIPAKVKMHEFVAANDFYPGPFVGCSGLQTVTFAEGMTKVPKGLFYLCDGIREMTLPSTIKEIEGDAFLDCANLTTVVIPASVTSIGDYAFCGCDRLKSVTLPAKLSYLGIGAFNDCKALKKINIPAKVKIDDSVAANDFYPGPFAGCSGLRTVTFDEGITRVPAGLFYLCGGIRKVTLPKTIKKIERSAFKDCNNLTTVVIPASVTRIEGYAFSGSRKLTSVTLPAKLSYLGIGAFSDCIALKKINIPAKVKIDDSVAANVFYPGPFAGCSALRTVTFAKGITKIPNGLFYLCDGIRTITIPSTVTIIGDSAFCCCDSLAKVTFGKKVKTLQGYAFAYCDKLAVPTFPASLRRIEDYAFAECPLFKTVVLPNELTYLGIGAFKNCKALAKINIPAKVKTHDYTAANDFYPGPFADCSALRTVTFAKGMTKIPRGLFYLCDGIRKITLPDTVTTIENDAFCCCNNLKEIHIGKKVKSIGDNAFYGCNALKQVYYDSGRDEWKKLEVGGGNDPLTNAKRHVNNYIYILCLGGCKGTEDDVTKVYNVLTKNTIPGYTLKRSGKKALTMSDLDMSKDLYLDKKDKLDMKKYLTKEFLDYYIKESFKGAKKNDLCFFYLHTHGMGGGPVGKEGRGLAIFNKKGEVITYTYEDFLETLGKNIKGQIIFLPDVCYSGGFVDWSRSWPVTGKDRLNILSSASISQASSDVLADNPLQYVVGALQGKNGLGNYTASLVAALKRPDLKADASKTKDGVSIQELFEYIKKTINTHGTNFHQVVQCYSQNKKMIIFH